MNNLNGYITTEEATKILDMKIKPLYRCLNGGLIEAHKENERWLINQYS